MTFVAQELTTFSNKGSTFKTYSISIIPGVTHRKFFRGSQFEKHCFGVK